MIGPITFFSSYSLFFSSLPYHLHDHQVRREDNWSNYIFLPGAWSSIALGKKKKTPNIWQGDKTWEKRVEDFYHVMLTYFSFSLIMPSKAFEVVETKLTIKLQKSRLLSFVIAEIWFCLIFIEFPFWPSILHIIPWFYSFFFLTFLLWINLYMEKEPTHIYLIDYDSSLLNLT